MVALKRKDPTDMESMNRFELMNELAENRERLHHVAELSREVRRLRDEIVVAVED